MLEGHLMPDHVHMLVSIPPRKGVSSFMGYMKGKGSLMIFDNHVNFNINLAIENFGLKDIYISMVASTRQLSENISKIRNATILCKTS